MSFFMWVQLFTTKEAPNEIDHLPWQSVYKTFKDACDSIVCYAADTEQEITLNPSASEEEAEIYPGALVATGPDNGTDKYYIYQVCLAARKPTYVDDFIVGDFVSEHIKSLIDPKANWDTGGCLAPPCDETEGKKMVRSVARKMLAATAAVAVAVAVAAPPPLFTEPMFAQTVE